MDVTGMENFATQGEKSLRLNHLGELSRATTAFYDAPPDGVERARKEYLEALRSFNACQSNQDLP